MRPATRSQASLRPEAPLRLALERGIAVLPWLRSAPEATPPPPPPPPRGGQILLCMQGGLGPALAQPAPWVNCRVQATPQRSHRPGLVERLLRGCVRARAPRGEFFARCRSLATAAQMVLVERR